MNKVEFQNPEDYAVHMAEHGRNKDAFEQFKKIISVSILGRPIYVKTRNILVQNKNGTFSPMVNKKLKLGIEGLYYFAEVARKIGEYADARLYYEEIVRTVIHEGDNHDQWVLDIHESSKHALEELSKIKPAGIAFSKN